MVALLSKGVSKICIDQLVDPFPHMSEQWSIGHWIVHRHGPRQVGALTRSVDRQIEAKAGIGPLRPKRGPDHIIRFLTLDDGWFNLIVQKDQPLPLRITMGLSQSLEYRLRWCGLISFSPPGLDHADESTDRLMGS